MQTHCQISYFIDDSEDIMSRFSACSLELLFFDTYFLCILPTFFSVFQSFLPSLLFLGIVQACPLLEDFRFSATRSSGVGCLAVANVRKLKRLTSEVICLLLAPC